MKQLNNQFFIACAGYGKTQLIVEESLKRSGEILITTFTDENTEIIKERTRIKNIAIPKNITIIPWYTFLLQECVRPYQNKCDFKNGSMESRVNGVNMNQPPTYKDKKTNKLRSLYNKNVKEYFFKYDLIYKDRLADFICMNDNMNNNIIIDRIKKCYSSILIDEGQDLSGWDFELLMSLMKVGVEIIIVADPRQKKLSTANTKKYTQFSKNISLWYDFLQQKKYGYTNNKIESKRSNQLICDFADTLFPDFEKTIATPLKASTEPNLDGVFYIKTNELNKYCSKYPEAVILITDKTIREKFNSNNKILNIGKAKGGTFDNVIIFPTKDMETFFNKQLIDAIDSPSNMYIAVTRARHRVVFVTDVEVNLSQVKRFKL